MTAFSGCCNSETFLRGTWFKQSYCGACDALCLWGLNYSVPWQSYAVAKDFYGNLWFCWHFVSNAETVQEMVSHGQTLVCGVREQVASLSQQFQRDGDLIPSHMHRAFMAEWKYQVANPEIAGIHD